MPDSNDYRLFVQSEFAGLKDTMNFQFVTVHESLLAINKHLEKLNGSVSEHQKVIDQNLPHTIALCPQNDIIKEIRDTVISEKAVEANEHKKKVVTWQIVAVVISLLFLITTVYFGFKRMNVKVDRIQNEVESQSVMMIEKRGGFAPIGTARGDTINVR